MIVKEKQVITVLKLTLCVLSREQKLFPNGGTGSVKCLLILCQHCRVSQQFAKVSKPLF